MTQEEKELVLKELCSRLPYGVKIKEQDGDYIDVNIYNAHIEHLIDRVGAGLDKMVFRPLSSMTKEEEIECEKLGLGFMASGEYADEETGFRTYIGQSFELIPQIETYDWLNEHHFDYRGLIEKDLALEAKEEIYNND